MPFQSGLEHIIREGELLAPYTAFRLGGPAQYFAEPTNADELVELVRRCRDEGLPVRLLGGGTNLLVRDRGVDGVVIHLAAAAFSQISVAGDCISAGGGARLAHLVSSAVREGLAGLESLVGIPGTVGGAVHGNAGTHAGDIGQWIAAATVLTRGGEVLSRNREDLHFGYRESSLDELVILDAKFALEHDAPGELTKRMQKLWIINKAAQPLSNQSAGMIFRDSSGIHAAMLIEQAGLKSASRGEVEVSDRNANYLVTGAKATAADVLQLIDQLRSGVAGRLGVELELSIEVW